MWENSKKTHLNMANFEEEIKKWNWGRWPEFYTLTGYFYHNIRTLLQIFIIFIWQVINVSNGSWTHELIIHLTLEKEEVPEIEIWHHTLANHKYMEHCSSIILNNIFHCMYNKGKEGSSQNQSHKGARDVFALKKKN